MNVLPINLSIEIRLSRILNICGLRFAEYRSFRALGGGREARKLVIILRKSLR